ncbi:glycosyltransferase [Pediococcus acidilactici]|uniref:glycosyltransferase family 2 protein n=1 Tax=Pediococcus acidilactici TaxID=1254 RepID=UPI001321C592|nr:glycosyltransferase family A protein [Pediococcus acidilactici]KAF0369889.1 glycosyltransferase [Pediococcus acidilactici]KAF0388531.1 glycosyltransferase [Pediococcus acidilactici]
MNEKLSIIIPVFNMEKYIARCLNSIVDQTLNNVSIICVNDGSTDNTRDILEEYKDKYPTLIQIVDIQNSGRANARNIGIDLVKDGYVWFIDPDDYIDSKAITKIMNCIKQRPDVIVFDWMNVFKNYERKATFGVGIESSGSGPANKVFKRSLIGKYRFPRDKWYEDLGLIPILVGLAKNIIKINECLYYYDRSRENSQTNSFDVSRITDTIPMCELVYRELIITKKKMYLKPEIQKLFYRHIVINTVLKKFQLIKSKEIKNAIINKANRSLTSYFPEWKDTRFEESRLKSTVKKVIVQMYFNKFYKSGNLLWKQYNFLKKLIRR